MFILSILFSKTTTTASDERTPEIVPYFAEAMGEPEPTVASTDGNIHYKGQTAPSAIEAMCENDK